MPLTSSSPLCVLEESGNDGVSGTTMGLPIVQQSESTIISEDYVRMLLQTIREHDAEKLALLQHIEESVKPEHAEAQRLRREMEQKDQELAKLQQDLSEKRLMLQEERERSNRLLHENTVLHAHAEDDRVRITSLLQARQQSKLNSMMEEKNNDNATCFHRSSNDVNSKRICTNSNQKFSFNNPPSRSNIKNNGGAGATMSLRQAVALSQEKQQQQQQQQHSSSFSGIKGSITLDTDTAIQEALHAPSSSTLVAALTAEVQMLKEQLDAQRVMYESERAKRLHEERERNRQHAEAVSHHLATIDQLHALHQTALADLIHSRHVMQKEARELRAQGEGLRVALEAAQAALVEKEKRRVGDVRGARRRGEEALAGVLRRLRGELAEARAGAIAGREEQRRWVEAAAAREEALRARVQEERRRRQRAEARLRLEAEGVGSEVNLMRQALRAMEKRVYFSQSRCLSA